MANKIYLGYGTTSGDAVSPSVQPVRWNSEDMVILDQKILDEHGSMETVIGIRDSDAEADGQRNPRTRIGFYVKPQADGINQINTSIRALTTQQIDVGGETFFKDVSFVHASTTYGTAQGAAQKAFSELVRTLLTYELASDGTTNSLWKLLNGGMATPNGVGDTYAGSQYV